MNYPFVEQSNIPETSAYGVYSYKDLVLSQKPVSENVPPRLQISQRVLAFAENTTESQCIVC